MSTTSTKGRNGVGRDRGYTMIIRYPSHHGFMIYFCWFWCFNKKMLIRYNYRSLSQPWPSTYVHQLSGWARRLRARAFNLHLLMTSMHFSNASYVCSWHWQDLKIKHIRLYLRQEMSNNIWKRFIHNFKPRFKPR